MDATGQETGRPASAPDAVDRAEPGLVASDDDAEPVPAGSGDRAKPVPAARGDRRPRDMAISLLVLLLPIAALFVLHRTFLGGDQPAVVDTAPTIALARSAGAFPVAEPAVGPAEGWRPIRADFRRADDGATLRIGYVSPGDGGVQLVQTSAPAERFLPAELTGAARPAEPAGIAGRDWRWYSTRPGEQALVLLEPDRTVVIVGDASRAELTELAASLR
ncbi:DUF4245 domain-containing protein [Solwaraspora sp. WMMD1047]|uniref:DUF4245 domain-containing protein n=1 Tax=Solwaraspora sp. WMMD1047 TaxID=3016102 RepID=UPI002415A640|nr:DUF4245 domain-containing protein [Solwaraspora sp. WMMD1047]MDG4833289.1 DUF4245 domain-containing protein [Solwaraspora sp. WMMD1047]